VSHVEWLNHSGFVIRTTGGTGLIIDPWFSGSVFNDGWSLLAETRTDVADLADCDHIWVSHEHPDHFSPAALKAFPAERRAQMTVWYQATRDHRVVDFCRDKLGFRVREMPEGETLEIGPGLRATCGTVANDSWLHLDVDGTSVLNMNDCEFRLRPELEQVAERVGPVDVLFTQFSYAKGIADIADSKRRAGQAEHKLAQMAHQVEVLRPGIVVPFASYVWFSHVENDYMNDQVVTIDRAVDHIRSLGATPVVLYPGDRWELGSDHDDEPALARYRADEADVPRRERTPAVPVPDHELLAAAAAHGERIREKNQLWALAPFRRTRYLQPVLLQVTDSEAGRFRYDMFDGLRVDHTDDPVDIIISSQSLAFCFRHEFGLNTLLVNGRFDQARPGGLLRLRMQFSPAMHNNHGHTFPAHFLNPRFIRTEAKRLLTRKRKELLAG
jgi:UDP-MurNAc hydroxylase